MIRDSEILINQWAHYFLMLKSEGSTRAHIRYDNDSPVQPPEQLTVRNSQQPEQTMAKSRLRRLSGPIIKNRCKVFFCTCGYNNQWIHKLH